MIDAATMPATPSNVDFEPSNDGDGATLSSSDDFAERTARFLRGAARMAGRDALGRAAATVGVGRTKALADGRRECSLGTRSNATDASRKTVDMLVDSR